MIGKKDLSSILAYKPNQDNALKNSFERQRGFLAQILDLCKEGNNFIESILLECNSSIIDNIIEDEFKKEYPLISFLHTNCSVIFKLNISFHYNEVLNSEKMDKNPQYKIIITFFGDDFNIKIKSDSCFLEDEDKEKLISSIRYSYFKKINQILEEDMGFEKKFVLENIENNKELQQIDAIIEELKKANSWSSNALVLKKMKEQKEFILNTNLSAKELLTFLNIIIKNGLVQDY